MVAFETVDQLALFVDLNVSGGEGLLQSITQVITNTLGLTATTEFKLRLRLSAAQGAVEVSDLTCSLPQSDNQISMAVSSQVVQVELCPCDNDPGSSNPMDLLRLGISGSPSGGLVGGLLGLVTNLLNIVDPLLGVDDVVLVLANNGDPDGNPTFGMSAPEVFYGTNYPFVKTGSASAENTFDLEETLNGLSNGDYVISVKDNGGVADDIVDEVFNSSQGLLTAVTAALGPALNRLGDALDDVFTTINLQLSPVVATVDGVNCENAMLTK